MVVVSLELFQKRDFSKAEVKSLEIVCISTDRKITVKQTRMKSNFSMNSFNKTS